MIISVAGGRPAMISATIGAMALVFGSRGLNTFQEFVLGSVSHKLAKRALAPVIIVK